METSEQFLQQVVLRLLDIVEGSSKHRYPPPLPGSTTTSDYAPTTAPRGYEVSTDDGFERAFVPLGGPDLSAFPNPWDVYREQNAEELARLEESEPDDETEE